MKATAISMPKIFLLLFSMAVGLFSLFAFSNQSQNLLLGLGLMLILPILFYLFVFQFRYFMAVVVFLFPMSLSHDFSGNVISFPSEAMLVLLSILFLGRLVFIRLPDRRFLYHPISLLLLLDLAWTLFTALLGTMPEISLKRFLMKFIFISVFYFSWAEFFSSPRNVRLFFISYSLGMVIPILNTFKNHSVHDFLMRAAFFVTEPFYADHTLYAACLTFVLLGVLAIVFYFRKELKAGQRAWLTLLIALLILADFLAFSRAAWLSFVAALMLWFILHFKVEKRVLFLFSLMALFLIFFNFNAILDSFERNRAVSSSEDIEEHIQSLTSISSDASNAERLNRWISSWEMFLHRPLLGFGPGTYQFQYGIYQRPEYLTRISTFQGDKGNAHSEYLNVLAESGVIGLFVLLVLLFCTFRCGLIAFWNSRDRSRKVILLMCLMALASYYVHGMVNCFIDTDKASILVYTTMAMICMQHLEFRKESSSN